MNTRRNGAVALGAAALIVLISGCAGVRSQDTAVDVAAQAGIHVQSQFDTAEIARREAAFMREQAHRNVGTAETSTQVNEATRLVKQQEARTAAALAEAAARSAEALRVVKQQEARSAVSTTPTSSRATEAMRLEKQEEARDAAEQLRQHQLEHGASSDRLR